MMYKLSTPEVDPRLAKFVELIPDRPKNRRRIAKTLLQKHIAINVFLYPATNNGIRLPKKVEDIISALEMWFRGRIASLTTFMEHWVRAERVIEIAWIVYNWSLEGQTAPLSLPSPLTKEYSSSTDAVSNAACPQKEENCQEPAHVVVAPVTLEEDVGDVDPRFAGFIDHFPESGKVWKLVRRILRKHVAFDVFLQPGFNSVMQQPKKVEDIISLLRERYGGRSRGEALPPVLEHWNRDGRLEAIARLVHHWYREGETAQLSLPASKEGFGSTSAGSTAASTPLIIPSSADTASNYSAKWSPIETPVLAIEAHTFAAQPEEATGTSESQGARITSLDLKEENSEAIAPAAVVPRTCRNMVEIDPRFANFIELLPDNPEVRGLAKRILQKHVAISICLHPKAKGIKNRQPKKGKDIVSLLRATYGATGAALETILEHWCRSGSLTKIAWSIHHWLLEDQKAPPSPPPSPTEEGSKSSTFSCTTTRKVQEQPAVSAASPDSSVIAEIKEGNAAEKNLASEPPIATASQPTSGLSVSKPVAVSAQATPTVIHSATIPCSSVLPGLGSGVNSPLPTADAAEPLSRLNATSIATTVAIDDTRVARALCDQVEVLEDKGITVQVLEGENAEASDNAPVVMAPGQNRKIELLKFALERLASKEEIDSSAEEEGTEAWIRGQLWLLSGQKAAEQTTSGNVAFDEIRKSVMFSGDVLRSYHTLLPQYGLLGMDKAVDDDSDADDRLFWNTNQPSSVYICGLQGSGKSHTLSCLLENCLIQCPSLGKLAQPLSGLVLHYSQFTSTSYFHPCEAAFLSMPSPDFPGKTSRVPVTVYCSPSNYHSLSASYGQIPGVTVKRLLFRPEQLGIATMLQLMAVSNSSAGTLYMSQVTKILRDMASESGVFNFLEFKRRLEELVLMKDQKNLLDQRMGLLESFLDLTGETDGCFSFPKGSLTIVDLSCPFVDEGMACVLFDIFVRIYFETDAGESAGKVVALDEAHRYMTDTPASKVLTTSLLGLIRQQRHFGARIIISSQEPTLDPRLLELSSMLVLHRFTSPQWARQLGQHVILEEWDKDGRGLLDRVTGLKTGEAVVFVQNAVLGGEEQGVRKVMGGFVNIAVRKRVTWDGGHSVVAVE